MRPVAEARTEAPTRRRRLEARQAGHVARSPLLTAAAALAATGLGLAAGGAWLAGRLADATRAALAGGGEVEGLGTEAWRWAAQVGEPLLGLLLGIVIAAALAGFAQVGPLLSFRAVRPDWSRVGPAEGWRRLTSPEARLARWRALLATGALVGVGVAVTASSLPWLGRLPRGDLAGLGLAAELAESWLLGSVIALGALGALDWAWQRRRLGASLRLTRSEAARERRETEGEPLVREARQRVWRHLASGGGGAASRAAVDAAVVVTAHDAAVAIYWDPAMVTAPEVLARAVGASAADLRRRARLHGVSVVEMPELARALAARVVGEAVPAAMFGQVASALRRAGRV